MHNYCALEKIVGYFAINLTIYIPQRLRKKFRSGASGLPARQNRNSYCSSLLLFFSSSFFSVVFLKTTGQQGNPAQECRMVWKWSDWYIVDVLGIGWVFIGADMHDKVAGRADKKA